MDVTLLSDLSEAGYDPAPARPDGFGITVREFMEAKSCTEGVARKMLEEAVKAGVLVKHLMRGGPGALPLIFCREKEWPPP
jgi:predicted transcriptional regulator